MRDRIQPLEIQKYIHYLSRKWMISFSAGLPDLAVQPVQPLKEAYHSLLEENENSFQYKAPLNSLKEKIQSIMAAQSVPCQLDEILITGGAQQGIFLTANLFFKENAQLIIDEFVYPGFLQMANLFNLNFLPVPSHFEEGIDLNHLEFLLKTQPVLPFLYIVCNGHNPLGSTLSNEKRQHLAYLADKYNFIILEDDPYGYLNFSDESYLPLRAYTKNALYLSSFSKVISPSVRTGWIVGDVKTIEKLQQLKDINDLYVSNPNHLALDKLLTHHHLSDLIYPQKISYQKKRDAMILALKHHLKIPHRYKIPKHGFFIWLEFLDLNIEHQHEFIFEKAKVLYIPSSAFLTKNISHTQAIRLNFSYPSLAEIELGIQRLSNVLSSQNPEKIDYAV